MLYYFIVVFRFAVYPDLHFGASIDLAFPLKVCYSPPQRGQRYFVVKTVVESKHFGGGAALVDIKQPHYPLLLADSVLILSH